MVVPSPQLALRRGKIILLVHEPLAATGANKIICTEDFLPSEIIQFCENNAQGFLTAFGSSDSHSAILAKSLDIPVIVGLGWDLLNDVRTGDSLTVDGREGTVILNEKSESFVS